MTTHADLIEKLAAIEHQRWSDWHIHMVSNNNPENMARWNRQAITAYKHLSEREKESDRKEVMRYWPLIAEAIVSERKQETARAEAYREVAIDGAKQAGLPIAFVDAECARIMKEREGKL